MYPTLLLSPFLHQFFPLPKQFSPLPKFIVIILFALEVQLILADHLLIVTLSLVVLLFFLFKLLLLLMQIQELKVLQLTISRLDQALVFILQ
jgi:hypothetical protein